MGHCTWVLALAQLTYYDTISGRGMELQTCVCEGGGKSVQVAIIARKVRIMAYKSAKKEVKRLVALRKGGAYKVFGMKMNEDAIRNLKLF